MAGSITSMFIAFYPSLFYYLLLLSIIIHTLLRLAPSLSGSPFVIIYLPSAILSRLFCRPSKSRRLANNSLSTFSSLISDQQFSPLGIVLFTILAEVCQKLNIELPSESDKAATGARAIAGTTGRPHGDAALAGKVVGPDVVGQQGGEDVGEVVEREDLAPGLALEEARGEDPAKAQGQRQITHARPREAQNQTLPSPHSRSVSTSGEKESTRADRVEKALSPSLPPLHSPINIQAKSKSKAPRSSSPPNPNPIQKPPKKKRKLLPPELEPGVSEHVSGLMTVEEPAGPTPFDESDGKLTATTPAKAGQIERTRVEMKERAEGTRAGGEPGKGKELTEGQKKVREREKGKTKENIKRKREKSNAKGNAIDELFGGLI
ncbi:MAG: hypothetical protein Q9160_002363 [Pyrenula sp. 1 TL-2023]